MDELTISQRLNNPITLAGLAVLSGNDLGTALNSAATLSRQKQIEQQQKAAFEQQQYMRENIGQLMRQLDPNDLAGSFATLVKAGVPIPNASALVDSMRKQQASQQTQQLLGGLLGGGGSGAAGIQGGDGMALMAAGALSGNSGLSTLGSAMNQKQQNDRNYGAGRDDQVFRRADALNKNFSKDSQKYISTKDSFQNMLDAASDPSGAGDVNMVYSYMKLLDPTSVVREGEAATAENAGGVNAKVRNAYNKILTGEKLNPTVREDFVKQANNIFNSQAKNHKQRIEQYSRRASKFGVSPDQVIEDYGTVRLPGQDKSIDSTIENIQPGASIMPKAQPGQSLAEAAAGDGAPAMGTKILRYNPATGRLE